MDDELKKQKAREYARRYRQENKEKVNEQRRLYKQRNKEKVKEWNNKYYARNTEKVKEKHRQDFQNKKEYYYQKRREYMIALMNWVEGMKKEKGCGNCGTLENLTYHHIDPNTKFMEIADMVNGMKNRNEILKEIKKCSVLCLRCHMNYHKENGKD